MPELPEVEYVARQLRETLIGSRIMRVEVLWPRAVSQMSPEDLIARLTGRRVLAVGRRAKYLVLTLDSGESLVIHRRMSGNLRLARADEAAPYTRIALTLSSGRRLLFTDPRKFGRMTIATPEELPVLFALQREGIEAVDGQQLMQRARLIKTQDEITLLTTACMMVDAAYDELYRHMKPGVRENECVGLVSKVLYDMGSEHVEGVNAISGERCSPHPHVFSDRALRPGDPAYFDILHSYNGYRTCYYRTFSIGSASPAMVDAYKKCRELLDAAIYTIKPGVTTADVVKLWPKAEEFGFPDEEAAFALQYGHGVGLSIWEKPIFSRLVSLEHPEVIEEGMVFALETFWPASDGWTAARIEEQLVVTKDGCEVITRFPAEQLLIAGAHYYTATGPLAPIRETESHKNIPPKH